MTAYTIITPALVAVGAKPFATTIQALRDNPIAIAECDPTAPVNAAGWHPYDKAFNNDANTGVFYSFATNGIQATVTSPDFVDGWDYAFLLEQVSHNGSLSQDLRINMFRETSAVYAGVITIGSILAAGSGTFWVEVPFARKTTSRQSIFYSGGPDVVDAVQAGVAYNVATVLHTTQQKLLRAQFSFASGSFDAGQISMWKRRNVAS